MKKLLLASALVLGLTLGACSDDDNDSKGSEPLCNRFPNFKKAWLESFDFHLHYTTCSSFAQDGVKLRLDNAIAKDGVTDEEIRDAFLTCTDDWLKTNDDAYRSRRDFVIKCVNACSSQTCPAGQHCFMTLCINGTGKKVTCTEDPSICKANQACVNGECKDKAPSPDPAPDPAPDPGANLNPSGKTCDDIPNFKAAFLSVVKEALAANKCELIDAKVDVLEKAALKDSLSKDDVSNMVESCSLGWFLSEPNTSELLRFIRDCSDGVK